MENVRTDWLELNAAFDVGNKELFTLKTAAVGGNSVRANLLAAVVGAFMYLATLTEVPIL